MEVLQEKGKYLLVKYGDNFAIEYSNENIGMTFLFSKDEDKVRERFNSIDENLPPEKNEYLIIW